MRGLLFIIAALVLTVASAQAQRVDATIVVDGQNRQFIVVRPSSNPPAGGFPLVFMFHGSSGDGEKFYNISGWKELGEREGVVTVFPSSLEVCINEDGQRKRTTKWNCGELVSIACEGQTLYDDVRFVRAMVDTITALLPIDRDRIYASGFSNGGGFTAKLAMEMSDVFSAIAVSAGGLHELDSVTPPAKVPIAYSTGSLDDRVTTPAGIPELPFNDSVLIYTGRIVRRFLGALELEETFERAQTELTLTYLWNTPLAGTAPGRFSFTLIKDLGHAYPNGTNSPITAANAFWAFFDANRGTSAAPSERALPLELDLTARTE